MDIAAGDAVERHRNHLTRLAIVAEAGGVGHVDELELDDRFDELQWRRNDLFECFRIRTVGDDQEFAIDEAIRTGRERRVVNRHGESIATDFVFSHGIFLCGKGMNEALTTC